MLDSLQDAGLYLIAEIANSHCGSAERMLHSIRELGDVDVSAIKFQLFDVEELVSPDHPQYDEFDALTFSDDQWNSFVNEARSHGLDVLFDVFGVTSFDRAERFDPDGLKLHPGDILNVPVLKRMARFGKRVLVGTSGCFKEEISNALRILEQGSGSSDLVLMTGVQSFPTEMADVKIAKVASLQESFGLPVGLSDHLEGGTPEAMWAPMMALSMGCRIFEKHFTLERESKATDYYSSLVKDEMASFSRMLRYGLLMLGSESKPLDDAEQEYRAKMLKHPFYSSDLVAGEVLAMNHLDYKRTGERVPNSLSLAPVGSPAQRMIKKGEAVREENHG